MKSTFNSNSFGNLSVLRSFLSLLQHHGRDQKGHGLVDQKKTNQWKRIEGRYSEKRMSEVAATPRKLVILSNRGWLYPRVLTFYRRPTDMEHLATIDATTVCQLKCDQPFFSWDIQEFHFLHQKMGLETPRVEGHYADGTLENVSMMVFLIPKVCRYTSACTHLYTAHPPALRSVHPSNACMHACASLWAKSLQLPAQQWHHA